MFLSVYLYIYLMLFLAESYQCHFDPHQQDIDLYNDACLFGQLAKVVFCGQKIILDNSCKHFN